MKLDARKSLKVLEDEWKNCTRCELGQHREEVGGEFVPGEGPRRRMMFIGEGPGTAEERHGRPFIGRSGELLRALLEKLGVMDHAYITNLVPCRSCVPLTDADGKTLTYTRRGITYTKFIDQPPTPPQIQACIERLHEEIYLVDPLIIVSLGGTAASALTGRPITITREAGNTRHITIPGLGSRPVFTEKRRMWRRVVKGKEVKPVTRNTVRYLLLPTFHPAYILRKGPDLDSRSDLKKLFAHIKEASETFEMMAGYYNLQLDLDINHNLTPEDLEEDE